MPLPVVFALASAISPADAVAVSAIVSRLPVAKRLIHILEGESLLNDASGLVCMRFAIAAATTGKFSPPEASTTFAWIGSIGATIGKAMTLLATTGKDWISRRFGEETRSQILISLLIPFAAYMQAERERQMRWTPIATHRVLQVQAAVAEGRLKQAKLDLAA
ncbi:CPA1 family monovalent cation:H+ antiporter [Rhizobium sp. BK491]|nr:CPA1 family monovalent cation:H+ antiporter [Rhizobium sp. BK491]